MKGSENMVGVQCMCECWQDAVERILGRNGEQKWTKENRKGKKKEKIRSE